MKVVQYVAVPVLMFARSSTQQESHCIMHGPIGLRSGRSWAPWPLAGPVWLVPPPAPGRMGDSSRQIAGFGPTFFNLCNVTLGAGILSYPVRPHSDPSLLCCPHP